MLFGGGLERLSVCVDVGVCRGECCLGAAWNGCLCGLASGCAEGMLGSAWNSGLCVDFGVCGGGVFGGGPGTVVCVLYLDGESVGSPPWRLT